MRRGVPWIIALVIAVVVVMDAVRARRSEKQASEKLAALRSPIALVAARRKEPHRVRLNGRTIVVGMETISGSVEGVLAGLTRSCASDDPEVALGLPRRGLDGVPSLGRVHLAAIKRESQPGGAAAICIFRGELDDLNDEDARAPRLRYALATETQPGVVSLLSLTVGSESTLDELFPETGDAPGSDPPHGGRPPSSRRRLTAEMEGDAYSVRVYEVDGTADVAVAAYDRAMLAGGWTRAYDLAASLPQARRFARGSEELIASFDTLAGTTAIAIATSPFTEQGASAEGKR